MPKPLLSDPARTPPESVPGDLFAPATRVGRSPARRPIEARRERLPDDSSTAAERAYGASSIEILEGLEPVRRRPGMYVGGTDERAYHHLFSEVLDNAMDEAVAGHASFIEVSVEARDALRVTDNGRGIPIDPHPKDTSKSALEVIMTTLHAGGKFDGTAYETSGGLHGVGISVVNALSSRLEVEVARGQVLHRQAYARGLPLGPLEVVGRVQNRRGTVVRFTPDTEIFGEALGFDPARLYGATRAKAYLFGGVEIRWSCEPGLAASAGVPAAEVLSYPGGLRDFLAREIEGAELVGDVFAGRTTRAGHGAAEWAVAWLGDRDGRVASFCNTIPTPEGGTHEAGLRATLLKGLKDHALRVGDKRAATLTTDDVMAPAVALLSVFVREPEFQGQTKDRLSSAEGARIVDAALRDAFDQFLGASPARAARLVDLAVEQAEERQRRRAEREVARKSPVRRLRLPGKLADCARAGMRGSELFIVEGDSAGGSAKQARDRQTQAVLPLRGKILNVASAGTGKAAGNQQLSDLALALGCGAGAAYRPENLRYERVIVMTDADVDGAHIASLLITYFYRAMPRLIEDEHLFIAAPPLYRLTVGAKTTYARDEAERDAMLAGPFKGRKVEIGRFKGLGEMLPAQLKETTMDPAKRVLLRVGVTSDREATADAVERLMGVKAEPRFAFIQERAVFAADVDL